MFGFAPQPDLATILHQERPQLELFQNVLAKEPWIVCLHKGILGEKDGEANSELFKEKEPRSGLGIRRIRSGLKSPLHLKMRC